MRRVVTLYLRKMSSQEQQLRHVVIKSKSCKLTWKKVEKLAHIQNATSEIFTSKETTQIEIKDKSSPGY